ncbi:MAG: protein-L-isoaspartate O-methyltransferase [Desulfovibrionaceae bacterium]|nr:protein-L-isoaspartate(D-aspartate) O-methyltransferase [Desulfovibrionaceae bacterium]PWM68847.1 MAG: protein-L-isoaspartate O-methyltransferase [Desulfovibrionaceae bacterium]
MSPVSLDYRIPRQRMVRDQIAGRGVANAAVLRAMGEVPRHLFVPEALAPTAYDDRPLPIGHGQTISQPYIVALMCSMLEPRPGLSVLEVGTGSGYQAAVLHALGLTVFTVERLRPLYLEARERFGRLGLHTIRTLLSDGTLGWPDMGPFDRIIVAAGGPGIPEALTEQLADGGVLVIPVGKRRGAQRLVRVVRHGLDLAVRDCGPVAFVDLVGSYGWNRTDGDEPTGR